MGKMNHNQKLVYFFLALALVLSLAALLSLFNPSCLKINPLIFPVQ